jgi:hypothetical protein
MRALALDASLRRLCELLQKSRRQAERAGLFLDDRELLNCTHCGLQEDVLIDGRLITVQADETTEPARADAANVSLRFAATENGNFICPQCGAAIAGDFFG